MKRLFSSFIFVALALLLASNVWASGPKGKGCKGGKCGCMADSAKPGPGFSQKLLALLDLTDDQQKQIDTLRNQMQTELDPVITQMRAKHDEMRLLWAAQNPDRNAIFAKESEISALREQIHALRTDFMLSIHKLLSPKQREKAADIFNRTPGMGKGSCGMNGPIFGAAPQCGADMGASCPCDSCPCAASPNADCSCNDCRCKNSASK